jgi:hypothetical protein
MQHGEDRRRGTSPRQISLKAMRLLWFSGFAVGAAKPGGTWGGAYLSRRGVLEYPLTIICVDGARSFRRFNSSLASKNRAVGRAYHGIVDP